MKKYRLSTTISPKHWSLLKKYSDKFETQQKALEQALESLDERMIASDLRSEDDKVWYRISKDMRTSIVLLHKEYFLTMLMTADVENYRKYIAMYRPVVFAIEYYYQKPLKECTLQEVLDCLLINSRVMNVAEDISYKDKGGYYELIIVHSFGITMSQMHVIAHENALEAYGVKFESNYSERTVFIKIYKNDSVNGIPGKEAGAAKPLAK